MGHYSINSHFPPINKITDTDFAYERHHVTYETCLRKSKSPDERRGEDDKNEAAVDRLVVEAVGVVG